MPICKPWCGYRVFNTFVWRTAATKPWVRRIDNLNSVPCMKSCAIHVTLWIHVTLRRCVDRKMWTFLHWNELGVASGKRWQCYMFNHCVCCYMKIKEIILLPFFFLFYCAGQQYWCMFLYINHAKPKSQIKRVFLTLLFPSSTVFWYAVLRKHKQWINWAWAAEVFKTPQVWSALIALGGRCLGISVLRCVNGANFWYC